MTQRFFRTHPTASVFPMMSEIELSELAADIKKHGLRHPIMLDHSGNLLVDGRNRQRACREVGVEPRYQPLSEETDLSAYVVSVNLQRRHLTVEQKVEVAVALLKENPWRSNRCLSRLAKLSHPKIAEIRREQEQIGDVEIVSTRIDASGREQPAHKPAALKPAAASTSGDIVTQPERVVMPARAGGYGSKSSRRTRWIAKRTADRRTAQQIRDQQTETALERGEPDPHREWPRPHEDAQAVVIKWPRQEDDSKRIAYLLRPNDASAMTYATGMLVPPRSSIA